ncbi:hypothetical protein EDB86DRAFT_3066499 [Lactarius hatsudake]|nr:hypothetical protein EDB86DRAFT_3066499 [Lactarius hatsudake]
MSSLRPPSPDASPVQGQKARTRSSMGSGGHPSAAAAQGLSISPRHALEVGPQHAPSQRAPGQCHLLNPRSIWEVTAAASLDVNFKEELSAIERCSLRAKRTAALYSPLQHSTQVQIRFFTVLQQIVRADPVTALLIPAVGGSMQSQMEAKLACMNIKSPGLKSTMPGSPSACTFNTSATNHQSLTFDTSSSSLSPDTANTIGSPSDAAATLAQQRQTESRRQRRTSGECGTWAGVLGQVAERDNSPTQEISVEPRSSRPQNTDFSVMSRASTAPTSSTRRPSKGHIHDSSGGSNNGVTNDGDLIQGHHAPGVGRGGTWSGAESPALSNTAGRFGGSDEGSNAMAAAHQQAALAGLGMGVGGFNLGLGSPGLAGMPNGLNIAQLTQLDGMNGMNPFGTNANILNLAGVTRGSCLRRRSPLLEEGSVSLGLAPVPLAVLNDVAGWLLRTLRLHKYTPNFEGMTWKEMVVMDEQALEAQGVAALGARRKMLKMYEVVRKKMGICASPAAAAWRTGIRSTGLDLGGLGWQRW